MDAYQIADLLGTLAAVALRTLVFPLALEKLLVFCRVNGRIAVIFGYILYMILAWPLMLFVTFGRLYGFQSGLGHIILDIIFLLLWITIRILRKKKKSTV